MKTKMIKIALPAILLFFCTHSSFSQCEIKNRVHSDGSMQYYMEPVNFYQTEIKSLRGCVVTDKENYFLELYPLPFPEKSKENKLKEDLTLKLADGNTYVFNHFDTFYDKKDTTLVMLFIIEKKNREKLLNFDVLEANLDMQGEEGVRTYVFKLHKAALKEQLNCFLKEEDEKKK